jgi:hypothetical protein
LIGCGQQKQETDEPMPAKDLYTSTYFSCKRRYAETVSQPGEDAPDGTPGWTILSAKHDVLWPSLEIEPYDETIDDLAEREAPVAPDAYQDTRYPWDEPLYETALDFWTRRVHFGLASWLGMQSGFPEEEPHCRRLYVLAGDDYVDPLLEHDVFEPFPWVTRFPFQEQDFDGIGEQMQWLSEEADRFEELRNDPAGSGRQTRVRSYRHREDPAVERPDTTGQTEWRDWMDSERSE